MTAFGERGLLIVIKTEICEKQDARNRHHLSIKHIYELICHTDIIEPFGLPRSVKA